MARIAGPFGIWSFPLLNILRDLVDRVKSKSNIMAPQSPVMRNIERITWVDWKGREREMTIHREVE